ncbi:hypothetical protein MMC16_003192 [Acarospora aff. strigata]|nr:hypothetical protein [Acarospora aff. strigata]
MSDSSTFDVKGYYAAKESYETLMREAKDSSATMGRKEAIEKKNKVQEPHPLLVPSLGEVRPSNVTKKEGKSSSVKE